jgi:lipopolysaccharide transport system permease protein
MSAHESQAPAVLHRITPSAESVAAYLREVFASWELLWILARRDVMVRYKQTFIGVSWAIFHPVLTMLVYWFIFGYLARFPSEGLPYPIFVFAALLPWQYIARVMGEGGQSVSGNANLVTKIYFPRVILPVSIAVSASVDLVIGLLLVMALGPFLGYGPGWNLLFLPLFWLFAVVTGLSIAMLIAPLEVRYRDVRFLLPIALQLWMLLSPILYPATMIPERFQALFQLNPVAIVAQGFRWSLLGQSAPPTTSAVLISGLIVLTLFLAALFMFQRSERLFADRI